MYQAPASRRWLTQQDAADHLGVHPHTIRNYAARGIITARRIKSSRLLRYDRHELDGLLEPVVSARFEAAEASMIGGGRGA